MHTRGFTLPELLIALTLASTLLATGWSGFRQLREAAALRAAARQVVAQLTLARRLAVDRRETIRFRADAAETALSAPDGRILERVALRGPDRLPVDSIRVRPSTLRFNPRGQAAPGSVYLYRGRRSIRIVCNFLGRLRTGAVTWS